jgi:hypothetical protein
MTVISAKGSTGDRMTMKTPARRSPADRDRAIARLRLLTIGTGIASVAAVGGFGAMAARSYDGTSGGTATTAIVTADGGTTTSGTTTPTAPSTTTTTTITSGAAAVQATAAPTAATGTAHATTGSS